MSVLETPILKRIALQIEEGNLGFRWIDLYSAEFVAKSLQADEQDYVNHLALIVCELSYASSKGMSCVSLKELRNKVGADNARAFLDDQLSELSVVENLTAEQTGSLLRSRRVDKPLVLDGEYLYLARYWNLESEFNTWLEDRLATPLTIDDVELKHLSLKLSSLFKFSPPNPGELALDVDWQAVAAAHALLQNTTFIAGGPGTGKTTTAVKLIYLVDQSLRLRSNRTAKVRLLAPTGKAAVRLADSIQSQLTQIEKEQVCDSTNLAPLSQVLPENGETIHRFLAEHKAMPGHRAYSDRYTAETLFLGGSKSIRCDADLLIIDEASMIDIALMVALVRIVSANTQVVFMGDPYQLPPVEPGEVFSKLVKKFEVQAYGTDLAAKLSYLTGYPLNTLNQTCEPSMKEVSDSKALCYLRKTYRFAGDLKKAAEQINRGEFIAFRNAYKRGVENLHERDVRWFALDIEDHQVDLTNSHVGEEILKAYKPYFDAVKTGVDLESLDKQFSQFQLLCSTHEGNQGVAQMNDIIERALLRQLGYSDVFDSSGFLYHGKAILITQNHTELGVFNGDIGFVVKSLSVPGHFRVLVPQGSGDAIAVSPKRLKSWQPAYAMTVHKSQGSEYKRVSLLLASYAKELLSRALVYTGLTRSKQSCDIWAGGRGSSEGI